MRLDEMRHQGPRERVWPVNFWRDLKINREPSPYWKSEAIATYVKIVRETKYD